MEIIILQKELGSDIRIKLKLTLSEIAKGIDKKIKIKRSVLADGVNFKSCPTCNGAGQVTSVQKYNTRSNEVIKSMPTLRGVR